MPQPTKNQYGQDVYDTSNLKTGDSIDASGNVITAESLTPTTAPNFVQSEEPAVYPVAGLNADGQAAPLPQEQEQSDIIKRTQSLYDELTGKATFQAEQEQAQNIAGLTKTQNDLSARLKTLQNEALAIPIRIEEESIGRGRTRSGITPLITGELRQNAIQSLGMASLLEASRGNLTLAQDLVDRAVAQKYDPIEARINVNLRNLELLSKDPTLTLAQRNRAEAQKTIQEQKRIEIEKQKENDAEIKGYAIEAAKRGASSDVLTRIQQAQTPAKALQIASFYLGADFRQEIEDKKFQKDLQTATYNLSLAKFEEDKRQFGIQEAVRQQEIADKKLQDLQKKNPVATAEVTSELLQDKINLIDTLISHSGLAKSVGPSKFGRIAPFKFSVLSGQAQDFSAGVSQLVNKETIDTLVNLKARGGTLGALSDQERVLLQSAATKIGTWEIRDKNGFGTGRYNASEEAFIKELKTIKNLAIKAKARALGGGISGTGTFDEDDALRQAGYSDEQIELLKQIQ